MTSLTRYAAGYVLDFFRERVTAEDFGGQTIRRVLLAPGLDELSVTAASTMFPGAELRRFDGRTGLWEIRRLRCDVVCIPMAGGETRARVVGLLSGARHKLLFPSADYIYRFGMRRGPAAILWAIIDRFVLAPVALLWMAVLGARVSAGGTARRVRAAVGRHEGR